MNVIQQYLDKHDLTQEQFGARVGVTQGAVWQWMLWLDTNGKEGSAITGDRAVDIEAKLGGGIKRAQLRPDLFGKAA